MKHTCEQCSNKCIVKATKGSKKPKRCIHRNTPDISVWKKVKKTPEV